MAQKNQNYWRKIAKKYNEFVGEQGDVRHEKIINPVVFDLLGNLQGNVVLDAGCGNGYLTRRMAKQARDVIGIDITPELIEISKQKTTVNNVKYIQASLEKIPFKDNYFNTILCNMVLVDIENIAGVIAEFSRVLKVGGTVVVSIIHPCFENPPCTYSMFEKDGKRIGRLVTKYFETGLVEDKANKIEGLAYLHYHYKISDYLNMFTKNNLFLEKIVEPNGYEISNDMGMNPDTPTFLVMKFVKKSE